MKAKHPSDSLTIMTELVLPNDTNNLNNLFGGQLLSWMDRCSAIAAHRHSKTIVVTASVNNVSFKKSIPQGTILTMEAKVSRAFTSSMEIYVDVFTESDDETHERVKSNEAMYTFVAVDNKGKSCPVPPIIPVTEEDKIRFDGALRRRQLALILSGKMEASEATELRALFVED